MEWHFQAQAICMLYNHGSEATSLSAFLNGDDNSACPTVLHEFITDQLPAHRKHYWCAEEIHRLRRNHTIQMPPGEPMVIEQRTSKVKVIHHKEFLKVRQLIIRRQNMKAKQATTGPTDLAPWQGARWASGMWPLQWVRNTTVRTPRCYNAIASLEPRRWIRGQKEWEQVWTSVSC